MFLFKLSNLNTRHKIYIYIIQIYHLTHILFYVNQYIMLFIQIKYLISISSKSQDIRKLDLIVKND